MSEEGEADEAQDPVAENAEEVKKPLVKRLILPLAGALVSAGLAFALAGIVSPAQEAEEEESVEFGEPFLIALPTIQVTLSDPDRQTFAKCTIQVSMEAEDEGIVQERIAGDRAVVIRDALNMHISGKTGADLKAPADKEILKLELIDLLNSILFEEGDGRVLAIYYDELMIQG